MTELSEEELVIARLLECIPNPRVGLVGEVVQSHRAKLQAQSLARRIRRRWAQSIGRGPKGTQVGEIAGLDRTNAP